LTAGQVAAQNPALETICRLRDGWNGGHSSLEVAMIDRSEPAYVLGHEIAALEAEIQSAMAACPPRQRFEIEPLRARLEALKAQMSVPAALPPHASLR